MALEPGTTLGHYEITAQIGKGGMGEVYRARDTRLGREVAIKVLPAELSQDEERLARLEREARMLAALNHPGIAAIYGLEESDGTRFLVLELVEGDTLADRLRQGAVPVGDALKLALQIAEALEAAHEKNVIHRDLKPANIKITPEGRVKVLDFGLAKAFIGDHADVNLSNSPTLSIAATQAGIILGTAAYMSPEQAEGEPADVRSDVWSFGVVLFEMLTGRPTFDGKTVPRVLAAVLNSDPDWNRLPANLNPRIRALLDRLLEKDHKDRLSSISDARVEVQRALDDPAGLIVAERPASAPHNLPVPIWLAIMGIVAVLVGGAAWVFKPDGAPPSSVFRFQEPARTMSLQAAASQPLDISADGTKLVQAGAGGIYLRSLDELPSRLIVPANNVAEAVGDPVFSPDGRNVAYFQGSLQGGQILRSAVDGGAPIPLTQTEGPPFGIHWASNGTIVYAMPDGIWQMADHGGTPARIVESQPGEVVGNPQLLPDGDHVLYARTRGRDETRWDEAEIVVTRLSDGVSQVLHLGGHTPRYLPTGHLVYVYNRTLYAARFDVDGLVLDEDRVPIVQGVGTSFGPGYAAGNARYAVSDTGTLVYIRTGAQTGDRELAMVSPNGVVEPIASLAGDYQNYVNPRLSPDETRVAVEIGNTIGGTTTSQIWVIDLETGIGRQLTLDGTVNRFPVWTAGGDAILFASDREDRFAIYRKSADGTGGTERIWEADNEEIVVPSSVSLDDVLAFTASNEGTGDVWALPLDQGDSAEATRIIEEARAAVFSPDGTTVAYLAGTGGMFIRPYPIVDDTVQRVPVDLAPPPLWYREGAELVYTDLGTGDVRSTQVATRPRLTLGPSSELFPITDINMPLPGSGGVFPPWDTASGRRLIIAHGVEAPASDETNVAGSQVNVVLNWFQELRERVPAD